MWKVQGRLTKANRQLPNFAPVSAAVPYCSTAGSILADPLFRLSPPFRPLPLCIAFFVIALE